VRLKQSIDLRLRKLETRESGNIGIWCDEPEQVPHTIDQMIAEGGLAETDRSRCVYWADLCCGPGRQEAALLLMP
jgi:hypothetical protein